MEDLNDILSNIFGKDNSIISFVYKQTLQISKRDEMDVILTE